MLKISKYTLPCIIAISFFSCDNLLKEDSSDLLIPKSVDDYAPILLGEGYPDNFNSQISFVNLMTDDVEMGPLDYDTEMVGDSKVTSWEKGIDPKAGYGQNAFIWQKDYQENLSDLFWSGRYSNILACNTIIEALPTMTYAEATQTGLYHKLAAQAYTLRAYHYFCLVNTYALPYATENLNQPGVVLKTSSEIEVTPHERATIGQVYALINDDIKKAQEHLESADTQASKMEITPEAVYFLAARIALFQNDWDGVIEAARKFLDLNEAIYNLNDEDEALLGFNISGVKDIGLDGTSYCANNTNLNEVIFAFGRHDSKILDYLSSTNTNLKYYEFGFHTSWTGDNALINLYDEDDLRKLAYFIRRYYKYGTARKPAYYVGQYFTLKYDARSGNNYTSQAWRTPELYLNLAEAYAQKANGVSEDAIKVLNQVRVKKYKSGSPKAEKSPADFSSKKELIKFIWQERRRELCFEEIMRFWDMRRQGMPAQEHWLFSTKNNYEVYKLKENSPNYVLPIPNDETSYNTAIINNFRETIGASSSGSLE